MWFQFYFTPLNGVLFTFPSRYLFTIDLKKYVALPVSSGVFTRAIRVSSYSRTTAIEMLWFRVRDYYPLECSFPAASTTLEFFYSTCCQRCSLITPIHNIAQRVSSRRGIVAEFVLFPFRSPLLREYLLVSFPLGTEMFYFPRSALPSV